MNNNDINSTINNNININNINDNNINDFVNKTIENTDDYI